MNVTFSIPELAGLTDLSFYIGLGYYGHLHAYVQTRRSSELTHTYDFELCMRPALPWYPFKVCWVSVPLCFLDPSSRAS